MTVEEFISDVLSKVPHGPRREQIETDLRAHLGERIEHGHSVDEAIQQFGDPDILAESYLASIPLVSGSFMSRVAAKLIDVPAVFLSSCVVLYIAWKLVGTPGEPFWPGIVRRDNPLIFAICIGMLVVVFPGYFIAAEYLTDQTLGKHVLGLRVVRESGARISLGQACVRQIPLIASFFIIDAIFALFTEKKQRAFELISKTRVVNIEDAPPAF
jgi:uncharacterized RDD family membrane protein YckC